MFLLNKPNINYECCPKCNDSVIYISTDLGDSKIKI